MHCGIFTSTTRSERRRNGDEAFEYFSYGMPKYVHKID